jgi:glycine cleavage system T protein (aminomethyltransferase)
MSQSTETTVRRTPLYDTHVALGAKMTPFAGFDMPVQYSGIIDEHVAVREAVGIFDVSHMGEVMVTGENSFEFVQNLVSNDVSKLVDGKALYTVMCTPNGGVVDDLLVYKLGDNRYLLVINAANIAGDFDWMKAHNSMGAMLQNISDDVALIAVQGPRAFNVLQKIAPIPIDDIGFYEFTELEPDSFFSCSLAILSHTGYTGEKGMEIYCDADRVCEIWDAVMEAGAEFGIKPAGLGARDTLRLESGFCLYGNDLDSDTNPLEAGLGWLTKLNAGNFVGRDALVKIKENGPERRLIGFVATERGIPRPGSEIQTEDGVVIGHVTSGTQSPLLKTGIGMGYVSNNPAFTAVGTEIRITSRGRSFTATVKKPPFHKS